jgi:hypothetical protein
MLDTLLIIITTLKPLRLDILLISTGDRIMAQSIRRRRGNSTGKGFGRLDSGWKVIFEFGEKYLLFTYRVFARRKRLVMEINSIAFSFELIFKF